MMKDKLLSLLNKNEFVSGGRLATKLNVSRTAIWKQINSLREHGYKIESKKNIGYRLISRPDKPFPEEISRNLNTKIIGKKVHYFEEISSTNIVAKQFVNEGASEGTIVIADIQTKGRGRKNRTWSSPMGGLWFSVILYPKIPPERAMLVTMTASISVAKAIDDQTKIKPTIKWPNDLLIDGKKVCGILTELDAEIDKINYSIVGIGLNANNDIDRELRDIAISIKQKIGHEISKVNLLKDILKNLDVYYNKLISGDIDFIRNIWFSYSNIIGRKIKIIGEKEIISGTVVEIDDSGCLIVETKKGKQRIVSGDITYL